MLDRCVPVSDRGADLGGVVPDERVLAARLQGGLDLGNSASAGATTVDAATVIVGAGAHEKDDGDDSGEDAPGARKERRSLW